MKHVLLSLALALVLPALLRAETADGMVRRIDSLYHASPAWRVTFDQTVRYPVFDETDEESGSLAVGPLGRFRLSMERHIIVSDGDTLWTHNLRANQVTVDLVEHAGEVVRPADFLFHFKEDYVPRLCEDLGPGQCLHLKTDEPTAFIREMWLWVDTASAHVRQAVYKDINLNVTTFHFHQIDFGYTPKADEFRYDPPPGVEVVRMP